MKQLHKHDCDTCLFLGTYHSQDLYVCSREQASLGMTIVARYGDDGHEYSSMSVTACSRLDHNGPGPQLLPELREAWRRWRSSVRTPV